MVSQYYQQGSKNTSSRVWGSVNDEFPGKTKKATAVSAAVPALQVVLKGSCIKEVSPKESKKKTG